MNAVLAIALALVSHAAYLAHMAAPGETASRAITFTFLDRHETQAFELLDDNGDTRPDELARFSHFVRCWRTGKELPMNPRTVEIVAALSHHFHDSRVEVVSGVRASPYGARHSKHFVGDAMDLRIPGVPARKVAAWVWKNFRHVGVGYYPKQQFVHVDSRELDVHWVDPSRHGQHRHATYAGRSLREVLPLNAPRLAYDVRAGQALPVDSVAVVDLPDAE